MQVWLGLPCLFNNQSGVVTDPVGPGSYCFFPGSQLDPDPVSFEDAGPDRIRIWFC